MMNANIPRQADMGGPTQIATTSVYQADPQTGRHGETYANSDNICLPSPSPDKQTWGHLSWCSTHLACGPDICRVMSPTLRKMHVSLITVMILATDGVAVRAADAKPPACKKKNNASIYVRTMCENLCAHIGILFNWTFKICGACWHEYKSFPQNLECRLGCPNSRGPKSNSFWGSGLLGPREGPGTKNELFYLFKRNHGRPTTPLWQSYVHVFYFCWAQISSLHQLVL